MTSKHIYISVKRDFSRYLLHRYILQAVMVLLYHTIADCRVEILQNSFMNIPAGFLYERCSFPVLAYVTVTEKINLPAALREIRGI